jgi:hypothetical protein
MELHGTKRLNIITSVFLSIVEFYTFDGGGFKIKFLHIQKEADSKFKNLLGFPFQLRKLFILPQFFTNKRRSPQSTD